MPLGNCFRVMSASFTLVLSDYTKPMFVSHISPHLTSSQLNALRCEATQFAVAAANQNAVARAADSELSDDPCDVANAGRHPISLLKSSCSRYRGSCDSFFLF